MKLWLDAPDQAARIAHHEGLIAAGEAIMGAEAGLDGDDMILFDLETDVATRFVALTLRHVHTQGCGRA